MLRKLLLVVLLNWCVQVLAQDTPTPVQPSNDLCDQLYAQMKAETSPDPEICYPTVGEAKPFDQCYKPFDYFGDRQASQVLLILDASGSMAGQINGRTKMSVAKLHSAKFLVEMANDLPVGLVVYGHKGSGDESDKQESCSGIELVLPVQQGRKEVGDAIDELRPTGWTPLAEALSFAETQFSQQASAKNDKDAVPVVYLISDGEETCDGDPVAAAKSLHESGIKATVHVIGFDVDDETQIQLKAISDAGGGRFFPAKDASALRNHLNAAIRSEVSHAHYNTCILTNEVKAIAPFRRATLSMPACINRETQGKFGSVMHKQIRALTGEEERACSLRLMSQVINEESAMRKSLINAYEKLQEQRTAAAEAARQYSIDNALPAKQ